tara:strand:+ start:287 stop:451 length:165 start_codon:yes stop_codon:yes gene_type:complete
MYTLLLKNNTEIIDKVSAKNLEEAKFFFMNRKQMNEETFNNLYEVKKEDDKKRK